MFGGRPFEPAGQASPRAWRSFPLKLAERCITLYSRERRISSRRPSLRGMTVATTVVAASRSWKEGAWAWNSTHVLCACQGMGGRPNRPFSGLTLNRSLLMMTVEWCFETLPPDSIQVTVTSPPYADFIRRSVEDRTKTHKTSRIVEHNNSTVKPYSDMGNLDYSQFIPACREVLGPLLKATKPGGYAVWVVKDHRLPPDLPYVPVARKFVELPLW